MKLLILNIKTFFMKKSTKKFIQIFLISLMLMLGLLWFIIRQFKSESLSYFSDSFKDEFVEIMNIPHTTNCHMILESSVLKTETTNTESSLLWSGDALNYRYIEEKHGRPQ